MKYSKYFNLRELTLDLNEILNEVEYLREENAELKKQVADYKEFIRNLNTKNQDIAVDIINHLINDIK